MINNIKQAIGKTLADSYPNLTIYDEDVPQKFKTPSFIINVVDMAYQKRLNQKYDGKITFDVAYFSDKKITEIKADLLTKQMVLFRAFEDAGQFRFWDKTARITDNVLHFIFDVSFSELKEEDFMKMMKKELRAGIKEV